MSAGLRRVLLVEDDPDIQAVALIALEDVGGLEVHACASGAEALREAAGFAPDLVLLDVMMPGLSGPDTLRAMRERPELRDLPVVFMTARVQKREVDEYLALGAIGVIPKPFEPMGLADELRGMLDAASEAREEREFEAKLAELRRQFDEGVPERLAALRAAWAAAKRGEADADEVRRRAHALVGTGRTMGREALAAFAAELEAHFDALGEAATHGAAAERTEALLAALEDEAGRGER